MHRACRERTDLENLDGMPPLSFVFATPADCALDGPDPQLYAPPVSRGYIGEMRYIALMLIVVAALSACANAVIGPVDHECHGNPARSYGSGCEDMGG
jgi:hypothetical protein